MTCRSLRARHHQRDSVRMGMSAATAYVAGGSPQGAVLMKTTQLLSIFAPESTPAKAIVELGAFVLAITGVVFVVVASLLVYAIVRFRATPTNADREPAQVYGSTQIELAWTVVPVLIVVVLFAATARVIHAIQDAPKPPTAIEVTVIGHQFWWERSEERRVGKEAAW